MPKDIRARESEFFKHDFSSPEVKWSLDGNAGNMQTIFALWISKLLSSTVKYAIS